MMKRHLRPALLVIALFAVSATANAGQFIMRAAAADADTLCLRYNLTDVRVVRVIGTDEICVVTANTQSADEDAALRARVLSDPLAKSFEIDNPVGLTEASLSAARAQSTSAILEGFALAPITYYGSLLSPAYVNQPAAGLIHLAAGQKLATGAGVVAVIDTGVDATHAALTGVLVPGYDFVNNVAGFPSDLAELTQSTAAILEQAQVAAPNTVALLNQSTAAILEQSAASQLAALPPLPAAFGHGTMVAGLIHLVAPTASIMPIKAFTADGNAQLSNLVSAVYYAADNGATVINMSFILATPSQSLLDAISYAAGKGVLCVASAGNGGVQMDTYPAAWPGVLDVASTDYADLRSLFSNWSSRVDMSAPGEALVTAYPGSHYAAVWGTSFSTALVSGSVALIQQYVPRISEAAALKFLGDGVRAPSGMGRARLDVLYALRAIFE